MGLDLIFRFLFISLLFLFIENSYINANIIDNNFKDKKYSSYDKKILKFIISMERKNISYYSEFNDYKLETIKDIFSFIVIKTKPHLYGYKIVSLIEKNENKLNSFIKQILLCDNQESLDTIVLSYLFLKQDIIQKYIQLNNEK